MDEFKKALCNDFRMIENWFHEKMMLLNAKKYYYIYFANNCQDDDFIFNGIMLTKSFKE